MGEKSHLGLELDIASSLTIGENVLQRLTVNSGSSGPIGENEPEPVSHSSVEAKCRTYLQILIKCRFPIAQSYRARLR